MGYRTPNIDRIAKEGALFTDWYGEQSCTAGRAAFVTGQSPIRTGLTKVGLPGADIGLQAEDPTVAEVLKSLGYATGQFGKNHLGDNDEFLPTNHGFDEFFGNLYHLNAEEEPENPDYPKDPAFRKRFGPRGVIKATADGQVEDTGPLTTKRMETVDEEFLPRRSSSSSREHRPARRGSPISTPTRMHVWTHLKPESQGETGLGLYPDGMVELDGYIGQLLQKLDDLGHRRRHHRALHLRQRRRGHELAGRRHDAVPRREGDELGGRLSRADGDPLARHHRARHDPQRGLRALRPDPDLRGGGRRAGRRQGAAGRSSATSRSRCTSTATT